MKDYLKILFLLLPVVCFTACDYIESLRRRTLHSNDVVVTIDEHQLFRKDIERMVPPGTSTADSIAIVDDFIKSWATDILMYRNAKRNVKNVDEIRRLLDDYERTITIHYYRQNMVQEKVEMPTDIEAESFYHMHQSEFLLNEPAIKGLIVTLPLANGRIVQLRKLMQKPEENIADIERFAMQNALVYSLFEDDWQLLSTVESSTGCNINVKGTGYYEFKDTVSVNMIFISGYVPQGEAAPFSLIKEDAKLRLFQIRKMQFLKNIDDEIYDYALSHGDIKFNKSMELSGLTDTADVVEPIINVPASVESGDKSVDKNNRSSQSDSKVSNREKKTEPTNANKYLNSVEPDKKAKSASDVVSSDSASYSNKSDHKSSQSVIVDTSNHTIKQSVKDTI